MIEFISSPMLMGFITGIVFLNLPNALMQECWIKPRQRRGYDDFMA
ncbi:MAG: hypothetical protein HUJ31_05085 [Pseudomonadales bacterium]|nr:hypothetical protein [Pseudomonadales bacterium]